MGTVSYTHLDVYKRQDLYKTSNGKYIAPQAIEMVMSGDQYIVLVGSAFSPSGKYPQFNIVNESSRQRDRVDCPLPYTVPTSRPTKLYPQSNTEFHRVL